MKIKKHLLGISIVMLLSAYAVTVYAGQEIKEYIETEIIEPEIRHPEADGNQGYYKTKPDVYIFHKQADAVTRYEFLAADNTRKTGSLELMDGQTEESVYLEADYFKDGDNILRVWMEMAPVKPDVGEGESPEESDTGENGEESGEPEGSQSESDESNDMEEENTFSGVPEIVFEKEIHFLLDTKKPQKVCFSYDKVIREGSIITNEPIELTVQSGDDGSGMEAVYYKAGEKNEGALTGDSGTITLNPGFSGTVEAYAVDKAGNRSESVISERILCENTPPEISLETEGSTDSWHSGPVKMNVKVNDNFLSAGLRSLKCYVQGDVRVYKENDYNTGVTDMETGFTVDIPSADGKGISVMVEAQDWAGNCCSESRQVYIDQAAPAIQSEGIHNDMIAGKPVNGKIIIQEENDLAIAKMEIRRVASDKKRELMEERTNELEPFSGPQKMEWDISLEEDGTYEVQLTARDRAGHETSQNYQIILDQANPVIRYVDQMQGVYVPYFQWNYGKEEVVQDETEYSYDIFLDGMFYTTGKRITKEGTKILQIKAVDAAGNASTAEAVFQIDHTPPKIRIYDVEDGSSYQDMAAISISVDGKGEYLKEISVNSEKMKLEANCQVFTQSFQEAGDYQIQILAEDLAGNQEKEQITFHIEAQKQLAGGVWKPITRIFRNVKDTSGQSETQEAASREKSPAVWILIVCFILAILASVLGAKMRLSKSRKYDRQSNYVGDRLQSLRGGMHE